MDELAIDFKNLRSAALAIAKREVKTAIKQGGAKVSSYTAKEISEMTYEALHKNFYSFISEALKAGYWE